MLKRLQSFTSRALNILTVLRAHCPLLVFKDIQASCSTVHTATCGQKFRILTPPAPDLYYKRQNSFRKRSKNPGFPILSTCTQTKSRITYHVNIRNTTLSCWLVLKTSIINSYQATFQSISDKMQEYILDKALPGSRQSDIQFLTHYWDCAGLFCSLTAVLNLHESRRYVSLDKIKLDKGVTY